MIPSAPSAESISLQIEVRELKSELSVTRRRIMGAALLTNLCLVSSLVSLTTGAVGGAWLWTVPAAAGTVSGIRLLVLRARQKRQLAQLEASLDPSTT